jgi:plasmid stabilization system protein ParE
MPRGQKSAYTDKQKRQAEHIEESEIDQGRSRDDAERIAWATVNKQDGGGKKSGSGRKTTGKSSSGGSSSKNSTPKKSA